MLANRPLEYSSSVSDSSSSRDLTTTPKFTSSVCRAEENTFLETTSEEKSCCCVAVPAVSLLARRDILPGVLGGGGVGGCVGKTPAADPRSRLVVHSRHLVALEPLDEIAAKIERFFGLANRSDDCEGGRTGGRGLA